PVAIIAALNPPVNQSITSWTVSYRRPGDATLVPLASGAGSNVSANFDPTRVQDGTYAINIRALSSGGGVTDSESRIVAVGYYKPDRYLTTFQDMSVNAANIPINLQRTYDSINKTRGDFGFGWNVDLSAFRVDTNGPLGRGGWKMTQCGFLGSQICYSS